MIKNPSVINTGNEVADGVLTVLLSTTILVGGVIGCLLDNLIPGNNIDFLVLTKLIKSEIGKINKIKQYIF